MKLTTAKRVLKGIAAGRSRRNQQPATRAQKRKALRQLDKLMDETGLAGRL